MMDELERRAVLCSPQAAVEDVRSPRTVLTQERTAPVGRLCTGDREQQTADRCSDNGGAIPCGNGPSGSRNGSDRSFNYVDFIHSKEQIEPVLQSVSRDLRRSQGNGDDDGVDIVMLDVRGDVSGPSKAAAAYIFTCSVDADAVPKVQPSPPAIASASARPAEAVAQPARNGRQLAMPSTAAGQTVHFGRL